MPATLPERCLDSTGEAEALYHRDGFSWAMQQAAALRRRDAAAIDWDRVVEEIEDLGIRHKDRWTSLCARVVEHLLAIEHWESATPETLQHWVREALNFRLQMAKVLRRNPGLQGQRLEMFATAWEDGRSDAVSRLTDYEDPSLKQRKAIERKWDRLRLPKECPYPVEHVAAYDPKRDRAPDSEIWPAAVAVVLNQRLGANYPILSEPGSDPGAGRAR